MKALRLLSAGAALALAGGAVADEGRHAFEANCAGCHQVGEGAVDGAGPALTGVVGRGVAATDFPYSEALTARSSETWTPETLSAYLAAPQDWAPGTYMASKLDDDVRDAVIDFLATHDGALAGYIVPPEILSMSGDAAYGEYLAGECASCHREGASADEIPSINGWENDRFVTALHAYRAGARTHPVMQMIAGRLDDEQIAALAAYFATQ